MCEVYPRAVVTIYFRAGDGTKPHIKVEQVLFPPLSSSDVGIRYLETGSQYVDPSGKDPVPVYLARCHNSCLYV